MVTHMKTTIDIPDDLMITAKKRAVELRRPFRELVIEGLKMQLASAHIKKPSAARKMRWTTHKGGVPPGMDLSDRQKMSEWLRGE